MGAAQMNQLKINSVGMREAFRKVPFVHVFR